MGNLAKNRSPHLRLSNDELDRYWIKPMPNDLGQAVSAVKITASNRYFLSGAVFIRYPDEKRPGKWCRGRLEFKLVAARRYFSASRRYVIKHFVSAITPKPIRRRYAAPFLKVVLHWLQHRGFDEVRFPIHSRRRHAAFQHVIEQLGFEHHLLNRLIFQIIVIDLKADETR